jgi:Sec-independent protein translocase protein TatA
MDILGIGPLEIIFILLLALIIFGPKDIIKASQSAGRFLRKMVTSPGWRAVQQTSKDLRNLPNKLMREAGIDEIEKELKEDAKDLKEMTKPPDLNKEIKEEFNKIGEGLSAWTSTPAAETGSGKTQPAEVKPEPAKPDQTSTSTSSPSTERN